MSSVIMTPNIIVTQPTSGAILSNYRQIRYTVGADITVPTDMPMYADVYYKLTSFYYYYKTLTAYTIDNSSGGHGLYLFDIQNCLQELLTTFLTIPIDTLPTNGIVLSKVTNNDPLHAIINSITDIKVLFRGATITDGILTPGIGAFGDIGVPVQGTATTLPITGGYDLMSNVISILNSSILPNIYLGSSIFDNKLELILIHNQLTAGTIPANTKVYPLSNLPKNDTDNLNQFQLAPTMYVNAWGYFPFIFKSVATFTNFRLQIEVLNHFGASTFYDLSTADSALSGVQTYYLPIGLPQIKALLNAASGSDVIYNSLIDPSNVNYYRIYLLESTLLHNMFYTPLYKVGSTLLEETTLQFQNMYGHFETVTFARTHTDVEVKSANQFQTYDQPLTTSWVSPYAPGNTKFNVRASDVLTLKTTVTEPLMGWLTELFMSPKILMQCYDSLEGTSFYKSVVIEDGSFVTRKTMIEGRANYEVQIKVRPQLEYIQLRN